MKGNEAGKNPYWAEGFFCLGIAVLSLWFFRATGTYVFGDDAIIHRYPFAVFIGRALTSGELPLWNPYNWSGSPFVADISADIWYPLNLLYAFLPSESVFKGLHLFHVVAGALAAYFCARVFGISRWGAFVSGLVYGTGPLFFHTIYNGYLILTIGLPYLPLVLGLYQLGESRNDLRWSAAAGLALGVQILGCHIQLGIFTAGLLIFKASHSWWGRRQGRDLWLPLGVALSIGALISSVKLLPFGVFAGEGLLAHGVGGQTQSSLMRLRQFYQASSASLSPFSWGQVLFPDPKAVQATPAYLGAGAAVLALIGGTQLDIRKTHGFFVVLVVLGFVLALGFYSPVQWLLYWLPGGQILRRPERFLIFFVLGISLLAGRGVDCLSREPDASRASLVRWWGKRWLRCALCGWVVADLVGLVLVSAYAQQVVEWMDRLWDTGALSFLQTVAKPATTVAIMRASLQELFVRQMDQLFFFPSSEAFLLGSTGLLLSGGLVAGAGRVLRGRGILVAAAASVVFSFSALHLLHQGEPDYHNIPGQFFGKSGVFRQIERDEGAFRVLCLGPDIDYGIPEGVVRHNQGMVSGFEEVHAMDNYVNHRYAALVNRINGQPPGSAPFRPVDMRVRNPYSPLVDLLNVKYAISRDSLDAGYYTLLMEDEVGLKLYEKRSFVPRARMVYDWREVGSLEAALDGLETAGFDGRTQVLVEGSLPRDFLPGLPPVDGSSAEIRKRSLNGLDLEVKSPVPALLVMSEVYTSGWQAILDGAETPILCADAAWRAVAIPAGKHHLRFRFRPGALIWGGGLALAGLGSAILLISGPGRRWQKDV